MYSGQQSAEGSLKERFPVREVLAPTRALVRSTVISFFLAGLCAAVTATSNSALVQVVSLLGFWVLSVRGYWKLVRYSSRHLIRLISGMTLCILSGVGVRGLFLADGVLTKLLVFVFALGSLMGGWLTLSARQASVSREKRLVPAGEGAKSAPDWQAICKRIADGFRKVRQGQFESAVRVIDRRFRGEFPRLRRTLGGEADSALRGFQEWITCSFLAEHEYVPWPESSVFFQELDAAEGWNSDDATPYALEFETCRDNPPEQCARLAFYLVSHIASVPDPRAAMPISALVPIFVLNTQTVIADAFDDRTTFMDLQRRIELLREKLTNARPGPPVA